MGKRRANAGASPPTKTKKRAAQSTSLPKMSQVTDQDRDRIQHDQPVYPSLELLNGPILSIIPCSVRIQDRRRSPRLNPDPPDVSTTSDPNPQTTESRQGSDRHRDISPKHDDRKKSGEQSPQYNTYGSDDDDIGGRLYDPGYMCPIGTQWYPPSHDDIEPDCSFSDVYQWTHNHVEEDDVVKGTILASEKQAIMDTLDGWCLYKGWDSLVGALPERALRCMTDLLARALVVKDIIETIGKNPFFYMDLGDDVSGRADALPPPLGLELYLLWQKLQKVDRVAAHKWREQTVHLMNMALPHQRPKDTFAGVRSLRLRRRIARQLATKMLDKSSPLYPLLRKDVDAQTKLARFKWMMRIYRHAAERSVKMWVDELGYQFYTDIHQIGLYDENSELYHMEWQTWLTFNDNDPNGRRTVLLLAPLIWQLQFGVDPTPREELDGFSPAPVDEDGHPNVIVCRGLVVLSKHVESEQTEEV